MISANGCVYYVCEPIYVCAECGWSYECNIALDRARVQVRTDDERCGPSVRCASAERSAPLAAAGQTRLSNVLRHDSSAVSTLQSLVWKNILHFYTCFYRFRLNVSVNPWPLIEHRFCSLDFNLVYWYIFFIRFLYDSFDTLSKKLYKCCTFLKSSYLPFQYRNNANIFMQMKMGAQKRTINRSQK